MCVASTCVHIVTCVCGTVFVGLYMCVVLYICMACVWYLSHCMSVWGVMYLCGMTCECGVFVWHYICVHVELQSVQCFCAMCVWCYVCYVALRVCGVMYLCGNTCDCVCGVMV